MRVLLLGGTTEAGQMAKALSKADIDAVYSYAGRTHSPVPQPLPTRVGGFGGVAGLIEYLGEKKLGFTLRYESFDLMKTGYRLESRMPREKKPPCVSP